MKNLVSAVVVGVFNGLGEGSAAAFLVDPMHGPLAMPIRSRNTEYVSGTRRNTPSYAVQYPSFLTERSVSHFPCVVCDSLRLAFDPV